MHFLVSSASVSEKDSTIPGTDVSNRDNEIVGPNVVPDKPKEKMLELTGSIGEEKAARETVNSSVQPHFGTEREPPSRGSISTSLNDETNDTISDQVSGSISSKGEQPPSSLGISHVPKSVENEKRIPRTAAKHRSKLRRVKKAMQQEIIKLYKENIQLGVELGNVVLENHLLWLEISPALSQDKTLSTSDSDADVT